MTEGGVKGEAKGGRNDGGRTEREGRQMKEQTAEGKKLDRERKETTCETILKPHSAIPKRSGVILKPHSGTET